MTVRFNPLGKYAFAAILGASTALSPAQAGKEISPYIEVGQILSADLKNGGDVLTYSSVAAGVDVALTSSRSEVQLSYRYERRIGYQKRVNDQDVHTGLARAKISVVPDLLDFEAGAIATRARSDIRGAAPASLAGNVDNITQVYSAYAGPTLATRVGDLDVTAAYRLGYTAVEAGDAVPLAAGQPRFDSYDHSLSHAATASVGMAAGVLPFGWVVNGGYNRDDSGQLDQRFESKFVRGDVTVPVTPTVAIVAGAGYENIEASQRDALLGPGGVPVVDAKGRFITDSSSPRRLAYNADGLYWDAGVLWRPSSRTALEARVGHRYGSMSYTGSLTLQASKDSGLQIGVYDTVETFGQQLNDNLALLPTSYRTARSGLGNVFGGCVYGTAGKGGCLNDVLNSINTSVYRSRGVSALWSASRGPWTTGIGLGYDQRRFSAPVQAGTFSSNGLTDESWYANGSVQYALSRNSNLSGDVYAAIFDPGVAGAGNVTSLGGTGTYAHTFGRNLSASASVGLYSYKQKDLGSDLTVTAGAGMRYTF